MRALSKLGAAVLVLAIVLATGVRPACSELQRISTDDDDLITRTFGGGAHDLPVRPNLTWREAVAWALTMPAVQAAMETFAERGYVAIAEHDSAVISIDPPATLVALPYRKPDLSLPDYHYGQPLILIRTLLDREGFPSTVVTAGLVILDPVNEAVFTADSLSELAETDASFDVAVTGPGEGGPGEKRLGPFEAASNVKPRFYKWVRCFGLGSLGCLRSFFHVTRYPGVIIFSFADPEVVGFYFTLCEGVVSTGCLFDYLDE